MRSVRSLILIGAIVALAAMAPVASASVEKPFHVVKVCANFRCVITSSSFNRIPVGTVINYTPNTDGSLTSVISVAHGTAAGRCDLTSIPSSPGSCVFSSGTGSLTGFRMNLVVDTEDGETWTWDGTYSYGSGR